MIRVLVGGDSVPLGERSDAEAWPERLPALVESLAADDVTVRADVGASLASLADHEFALDGLTVVLVHAGHNDAQLSGGDPRVTEAAFREAAADLDRRLDDAADVSRHAFVGLVPLLPLDREGAVPFSDEQPGRSLRYDDLLAERVATHLPVVRPVDDWADRTADGVHPNGAGHAFLADRVAEWLRASDPS